MSKHPMISVIVPIYKAEAYLEQCIQSILNQTYSDLEILLVDDGSPDNSGRICDEFQKKDSRIRVIHQKNSGVSAARNRALDEATGELIAFADSDDYLAPTMYEKLIHTMGDAPIVFCRFAYEYQDGVQYRYEKNLAYLKDRPFDFKYYSDDNGSKLEGNILSCDRVFGSIWRSLFRKELIDAHNIRFSDRLKIAEDRMFLLEYVMHCEKAAVVDEYLYYYRMTNSASATANTFGKYNPDLAERDQYLAVRQIELAENNSFLTKSERALFIRKTKLSAISEVVQNEIRYNPDYKAALNAIRHDEFYGNAIHLSELQTAYANGGVKRLLYFVLIKCALWDVIKKRVM